MPGIDEILNWARVPFEVVTHKKAAGNSPESSKKEWAAVSQLHPEWSINRRRTSRKMFKAEVEGGDSIQNQPL